MAIKTKLAGLWEQMLPIATNDMGELSYAEAALFHIALQAIENIIDSMQSQEG